MPARATWRRSRSRSARLRVAGLLGLGWLIFMAAFAPGAQASMVSNVSVTNSSPSNAAGARTVYSISFTSSATGGLSAAAGSKITITFPSGTDLTTVDSSSVLNSANTDIGSCSESGLVATCGFFSGDSVAASSTVTVNLDGVTNKSATAPGTRDALQIATTADTTAVSGFFLVVSGNPITKLSAVNSSPSNAAGARTVYSIQFDTSATGGLSAAANSQITIAFPTGTNLTTVDSSSVLNSANTDIGSCSQSGLTATCGFFSGNTVAAGSPLTVQLDGVTNAPANPTGGQLSLSAQTTSDTATQSANFTVVSGNPITKLSAVNSSPSNAAGARTVYSIQFDTSATGGLSAAANSQITITFPTGTNLTTVDSSSVLNSANTDIGSCSQSGLTATCGFFSGNTVAAGSPLTVQLDGVTNPSAGSPTLTAQTTSDTSTVTSSAYTVVNRNPITGLSATINSPSNAAGARTVYSIQFDTSATGGLSAAADSQITITFPTGTNLATVDASSVLNSVNTDIGSCSASGLVATCGFFTGNGVGANSAITVQLDGVTNPSAGSPTLTAQTTSDTSTVTSSAYTVLANHQITQPSVGLSNPVPGATGVNYAISFGTSSTGGLSAAADSQITIVFPSGTDLSKVTSSSVLNSANTDIGSCSESGLTVTCGFFGGNTVGANAVLTVQLDSVTNPPSTETTALTVGTTSDPTPVTSGPYGVGSTPAVSGVSPASGSTAGGTTVMITGRNLTGATGVKFGSTNATAVSDLSPTAVSATSPAGAAGTVDITVTAPGGSSPANAADRFTYVPTPAVTGVNPSSGPAAGGTTVTITGGNLTGATAVSFGPNAATNVAVVNSTTITATSPPGTGTVDVTVATPNGTSATGAADQFTYNPVSIASLPPAPAAPTVSGGAPSGETSNGAGVSGSVNPEGVATTAYFEYGLDPSERGPGAPTTLYDQSTPVQQVGSDTSFHAITAQLAGLVPGALYHARIVATNSAGTTFGPDQTFTTSPAPAPPPPSLGRSENVQPVSGSVFIKLPSGAFVKLTGNQQIPSGAEIDALHGSLGLTTATGRKGKTQRGVFGGAVFKVAQSRGGATKGLVTLSIVEGAFQGAPSYSLCTKHKATDGSAASLSSRTLQLLHASAHGKFRTSGRYSAATVRGTIWTVADRCDGTLTHDVTDSVSVTDFVRHKTITLHAGQSYLAKKPSGLARFDFTRAER